MKTNWRHNLFYFPTTLLILDDDVDFLGEIYLFLKSNNLLARTFSNSKPFLHYLTHYASPINTDELFIKTEVDYYKGSSGIMRADTNSIYKIAYNPSRFDQVSVVIIDYELLNETGIDVCRRIKNKNIKKIMLTNKASHKIGIDALNKKIIDAFIEKDEILDSLIQTIKSLEMEYFFELSKKMNYTCEIMQEPFLANLIDIFINSKSPSEYYIFNNNKSFLFFSADATPSMLVIENESTVKNIENSLKKDNISPEILLPILERRSLPSGWNTSKYLLGEYDLQTKACKKISGNQEDYYYYYSEILPTIDVDFSNIFSFSQKLSEKF